MPQLKGVSFETAIIERYRRRESSVKEALIEMYLAGVSVHLWRTSPKRCREQGLARHHQRAEQESLRPYRGLAQPPLAGQAVSVCLCGRHLPVPQPERIVRNVVILMAIAVNEDGFREVLGAAVGMKKDKASWVTSSSGSADAAWMA